MRPSRESPLRSPRRRRAPRRRQLRPRGARARRATRGASGRERHAETPPRDSLLRRRPLATGLVSPRRAGRVGQRPRRELGRCLLPRALTRDRPRPGRGTPHPPRRVQRAQRALPAPAAAPPQPEPTLWAAGKQPEQRCDPLFVVAGHRLTRRSTRSQSSLELRPELPEAARDPARDRPRRQVERLADRLVALVAAEEAIEHLPARLADRLEAGADGQRLVEQRERLVEAAGVELVELRRRLPAARRAGGRGRAAG